MTPESTMKNQLSGIWAERFYVDQLRYAKKDHAYGRTHVPEVWTRSERSELSLEQLRACVLEIKGLKTQVAMMSQRRVRYFCIRLTFRLSVSSTTAFRVLIIRGRVSQKAPTVSKFFNILAD